MAYKNYTVNKLLRFGKVSTRIVCIPSNGAKLDQQVKERMLGVYHDKLTSSSYHGKGTLREHVRPLSTPFLMSFMWLTRFRQYSQFSWPLRCLESVELVSSVKPCQFKVSMKTEKVLSLHCSVPSPRLILNVARQNESKTYLFEARTPEEACEIVGKLQYCSKKLTEGKENAK